MHAELAIVSNSSNLSSCIQEKHTDLIIIMIRKTASDNPHVLADSERWALCLVHAADTDNTRQDIFVLSVSAV